MITLSIPHAVYNELNYDDKKHENKRKAIPTKYQCLGNWAIGAPHLVPAYNIAPIYVVSLAFHTNNIRSS